MGVSEGTSPRSWCWRCLSSLRSPRFPIGRPHTLSVSPPWWQLTCRRQSSLPKHDPLGSSGTELLIRSRVLAVQAIATAWTAFLFVHARTWPTQAWSDAVLSSSPHRPLSSSPDRARLYTTSSARCQEPLCNPLPVRRTGWGSAHGALRSLGSQRGLRVAIALMGPYPFRHAYLIVARHFPRASRITPSAWMNARAP